MHRFIAAALFAFACASEGPAPDEVEPVAEIGEFAESYPQLRCASLFGCSPDAGASIYGTEEGCERAKSQALADAESQGCELDGDAATACLVALAEIVNGDAACPADVSTMPECDSAVLFTCPDGGDTGFSY